VTSVRLFDDEGPAHPVVRDLRPGNRMHGIRSKVLTLILALAAMAGCDVLTDAATRLAYDIEAGVDRLGHEPDATYSIQHTPAEADECSGPYTVQLDKVGALILWCKDVSGNTVASGSTTWHSRFVDTPQTHVLDKAAGTTLMIEIQRRNGRAVVIDAH